MGLLMEYFRASDATVAASAGVRGPGGGSFDRVVANGIDPQVTLGRLVELVRGEPGFAVGAGPAGVADAVYQLHDRVAQTLADIDDLRVPEYAARWSLSDGFGDDTDIGGLAYLIEGLSGLARRAREADQRLYCWVSPQRG